MGKLRRITAIADVIVFVAATLAIAGVFYEGMTLRWYFYIWFLYGILIVKRCESARQGEV